MKIIKNTVKTNYSFQMIIIILFLKSIYYSFSSISIGKFPYVKRLNNGDYIIISSINIVFTHNTLTEQKKTYTFDSEIYWNLDELTSTTIVQFTPNDNGYILSIAYKSLYVFSSNEVLLKIINLSSIINGQYTISLIPSGHSQNNYYFSLIYGDNIGEDIQTLFFKKGIFNSESKEITFNENLYSFNPHIQFKNYFSCELMEKNGVELIACLLLWK